MRMYDARIGKHMSIDPQQNKNPYVFADSSKNMAVKPKKNKTKATH